MRRVVRSLLILPLLTTLLAFSVVSCGGGSDQPSVKTYKAANQGYSTDDLYRFFAVAFGAAPGVTYMGQLIEAAEWGLSIKEIVNIFTTKPEFTDTYPVSMSNADFATKLVENVVGSSATSQAKQEAVNDIVSALSLPNWTRGDVIYAVFNNLASKPESDAKWYGTAKKMTNQVVFAKHFTEDLLIDTTLLTQLRKAVSAADETKDAYLLEQKILSTLDISNITNAKNTFVTLQVKDKAFIGSNFEITWTATNQYQCALMTQANAAYSTSNAVTVKSVAGGQHLYSFKCTNGTVRTNQIVKLITPMKVFASSYENKNAIDFDATQIPLLRALNIPKVVSGEQDSVDRSVAFGDFFQEGKYSAFVMASNSDGAYGPFLPGTIAGIGFFLDQDANGNWKDRSAEVFKSTSHRLGCISPSYSAVADFNNDMKPDVFIACTGLDFEIPGATPEQNRAAGRSYQIVYLSQPDGSYKSQKIEESNPLYGHKGVAIDINGDGNVDILTTDISNPAQPSGCGVPYVLLGRGDGTFTRNYSFIDEYFVREKMPLCGFFNIDIIPIDGRYDLFIGGLIRKPNDQGSWSLLWLKGKTGGFSYTDYKLIEMPLNPTSGQQYQFPLDIVFDATGRHLLMKTTTVESTWTEWATLKFDTNGSLVGIIDRWINDQYEPRAPQFKPSINSPGYLIGYTSGCAIELSKGDCGRKIKFD